MNYRWDWGILLQDPYWGWIWSGLGLTLLMTLISWLIALTVGLTVGVARSLPNRALNALGSVYVEVFRNIPALAQLFFWYFVFPDIVPNALGVWLKRDLPDPEFMTAAVGIGLFMGARVAEQVRAGIGAVAIHLLPAALATGLRPLQAFRLVLLPLGLRAIIGPLTSEFLITVKMTSISLTIGVLELTGQSRHIENYTFHGLETFTVATAAYLAIGLAVTALMRNINRRVNGIHQREADNGPI
ncbi:MAG TPA: amino acid ABC transporter permease [Castellaniella sp.]|jgi:glutamate/aspartate transport system permease protein|nr:amino acid ABC transporter permease [Castellaniella sp.]